MKVNKYKSRRYETDGKGGYEEKYSFIGMC